MNTPVKMPYLQNYMTFYFQYLPNIKKAEHKAREEVHEEEEEEDMEE